jgi:catechol 2,3-dioxygenase-like lactoylglutathione lyase family enzyme
MRYQAASSAMPRAEKDGTMQFAHVNIVARDWRGLAQFYRNVFGCIPVLPERNLAGTWLDNLTGLKGASLQGVHLALPGFARGGPTLEIFTYANEPPDAGKAVNRPGLAHTAFRTRNVARLRNAVIRHGGGSVGEIVTTTIEGAGRLTVAYVTDPEGNVIELQTWTATRAANRKANAAR